MEDINPNIETSSASDNQDMDDDTTSQKKDLGSVTVMEKRVKELEAANTLGQGTKPFQRRLRY